MIGPVAVVPETGVAGGFEPHVSSAEYGHAVPGARLAGEVWVAETVAKFESALQAGAQSDHEQGEQGGRFFTTFTLGEDRYTDMQVTFSWTAPEARETKADQTRHVGTMMFTQDTRDGQHSVLSYSLFESPLGAVIEGQVGRYTGDEPVGALALGGHIQPGPDFMSLTGNPAVSNNYEPSMYNMPGITNNELTSAIDYANGALSATGYMDAVASIEGGPSADAAAAAGSAGPGEAGGAGPA
jgi:hypothetical protein